MVRYQVDIEKAVGAEFWTNRYLIEAADLDEASTLTGFLVTGERSFHQNTVEFTKARVMTWPESDGEFKIITLNDFGELAVTGGSLPLFNVFRVDLQVASGRPSRKYYRTPVMENDQIDGNVMTAKLASLTPLINAMITDMEGALVDPQGSSITSCAVAGRVGMRQLRRGSKKTPIIPG